MKELENGVAQKIMDLIKVEKNLTVLSITSADAEFIIKKDLTDVKESGRVICAVNIINPKSNEDDILSLAAAYTPVATEESIIKDFLECIPAKNELIAGKSEEGLMIMKLVEEFISTIESDIEFGGDIGEMAEEAMKDFKEAQRKSDLFEKYKQKSKIEDPAKYFILKMMESEVREGKMDLEELEKRVLELDERFIL